MTEEIFFYNQNDKYGCFSNFYNIEFVDEEGTKFYNSEQYFMLQKCKLFDPNGSTYKAILSEKNPTKVKALGRKINNYNDEIWEKQRYDVMKKGVYLKFSQNQDIKNILLSTDNKILYEASPYDKIWGIGFNTTDAQKTSNRTKFGRNLLGKVLIEIRELLKQ